MDENPNTYAESPVDEINHPPHYTEGRMFEPIDVIDDWGIGFNLGNVVRYVSRAGRKQGETAVKDLLKAQFYLNYEINRLNDSVEAELAAQEAEYAAAAELKAREAKEAAQARSAAKRRR